MTNEQWRDVPGYKGRYRVSSKGHVYSLLTDKVLKQDTNRTGYNLVRLYKGGESKTLYVHRLVLLAFVGDSELDTNHKNGIRDDNRLANLEYVTPKQNTAHAIRLNGTWHPGGEDHPMAKLSRKEVREIRRLKGQMTQRAMAEKYGVGEAQISRIISGTRW